MNKKLSFTHAKTLRGWLEIVRPPNLFTIPGDILAGASLAFLVEDRIHKVFPVIIISLLLYISGLILNDYFDCKVDRIERPLRPIPSGRVRPRVSFLVSMVLIGTAIGIGFLISGRGFLPGTLPFFTTQGTLTLKVVLILVVLILLYNGPARRIPWLGFIVMGLCRGFNILLGASVSDEFYTSKVFYGAGIETFYIRSVSSLASNEAKGLLPTRIQCLLPCSVLFMLVVLVFMEGISLVRIGALLLTIGWISYILWHIRCDAGQIPAKVGDLIRGLILIQFTMVAMCIECNNQYRYSCLIMVLFIFFFFASRLVGRKFYGS